jgi:hypothetical protein
MGDYYDCFETIQTRYLGVSLIEKGYLIKVSHPAIRNKRIIGIVLKTKITLAKSEEDVAHGLITLFSSAGITYHSLTSAELISKI